MAQERASDAALRPSVFGKVANKYFGDMKEQTQAQMEGIQQDLHAERKQLFVLMGVMLVFCAATFGMVIGANYVTKENVNDDHVIEGVHLMTDKKTHEPVTIQSIDAPLAEKSIEDIIVEYDGDIEGLAAALEEVKVLNAEEENGNSVTRSVDGFTVSKEGDKVMFFSSQGDKFWYTAQGLEHVDLNDILPRLGRNSFLRKTTRAD